MDLKGENEQLARQLEGLQMGHFLWEFVFQNPDFGLIVCEFDRDTETIKRMSESAINHFGYTPKEMEGRPYYDFMHDEDVIRTKDLVVNKLRKGGEAVGFTNRYRGKDGEYVICTWFTAGGKERKQLAFAMVRDMTEICDVCKDPVIRLIRLGLDPSLKRVGE